MADIMNEGEVPATWQPVNQPPIIPSAPPQPNVMGNYFQGSISPQMQHDPVFVGTEYGGPRTPSISLMPVLPSGIPSFNAAIRSLAPATATTSVVSGPDIDYVGINYQTGTTYTVQVSDFDTMISFSNNSGGTITLVGSGSFPIGWFCYIENTGTGTFVLTSLDKIDGVVLPVSIGSNNGILVVFAGPV